MSSGPLPAGTLLIRVRWGNWDSWRFRWKPLPEDWTTTANISKVESGLQLCTCKRVHVRMHTHTQGFLQLFQGLGIIGPEVWGNGLPKWWGSLSLWTNPRIPFPGFLGSSEWWRVLRAQGRSDSELLA